MPLIEISSLRPQFGVDAVTIAREVNLAVAEVLPCPLDSVTTTWRVIAGPYVVGAAVSAVQRRDSHGPIVHVYLADDEGDAELVRGTVARVLSRAMSLAPANVIVLLHPVEALTADPVQRPFRQPRRRGAAAASG